MVKEELDVLHIGFYQGEEIGRSKLFAKGIDGKIYGARESRPYVHIGFGVEIMNNIKSSKLDNIVLHPGETGEANCQPLKDTMKLIELLTEISGQSGYKVGVTISERYLRVPRSK